MSEKSNGWPTEKVGDCLRLINGRAFKPNEWSQIGLPIIRIQNLNNHSALYNYYAGDLPEKFLIRNGDLLFAWSGTPGTSFGAHIWHGDKAWLNQHIFKVIFDPTKFDIKFLQLAINQNLSEYIRAAHGAAGLAHITKGRFESSNIPCPEINEQRQIVAEIEKQFTRLDAGVSALKRAKTNLKRYRASVLKAACEGRLVATEAELARKEGRSFETGEQLLQRILTERRKNWNGRKKNVEPSPPTIDGLTQLREGWTWTKGHQIGHVSGGLTKNPKRAKFSQILPYLRVANVYANQLRLEEIEQIGVDPSEIPKLLLEKNDLLVVEGNGSKDQIGRVALWDASISPCLHQNHIIKVRFIDKSVSKFVLYWLLSPLGRNFIELVSSSTSGLYTLSINKVGELPIPLPPLNEQERIVREIERAFSVIDEMALTINANLQRAIRMRQSILHQAFSGNLVQVRTGNAQEKENQAQT